MVHSINVRICAEGIEEREWLLKMKAMKVDYLQGYYFGRPCGKKQFLQQYARGINVKMCIRDSHYAGAGKSTGRFYTADCR